MDSSAAQNEESPRSLSVSGSLESSQLSAASTSSAGEVAHLSQRQLLLSLCLPCSNGRRKCRHCSHDFAETSSSSSLLYHFQTEHNALWNAVQPASKPRRMPFQPTIQETFDSKALTNGFQDVVDSFIAHPGLPLSLADCPLFRRTLKYPQGVTSRSIRQGIINKDAQLLKQLRVLLQGKVVGLQIDGGKTVSHRKVLGVGFTLQGTFYCWAVVDCIQGVIWNEEFYCNMLKEIIHEIEGYGAYVASVTADNEQITTTSGLLEILLLLRATMPIEIKNVH